MRRFISCHHDEPVSSWVRGCVCSLGAVRRGGVLVEGLVSWLLSASMMLHDHVSEQCDLVA